MSKSRHENACLSGRVRDLSVSKAIQKSLKILSIIAILIQLVRSHWKHGTCFTNNSKDFGTSVGVNLPELPQCIWLSTSYCAALRMDRFHHMDHCVSSTLESGETVFLK